MASENSEKIYAVNSNDEITSEIDKLEAHQKGILHRAFSIFILDSDGNHLLQKRADHKYHSPGLWSNACCSHHKVDTDFNQHIHKRLFYEIGLRGINIKKLFNTIYKLDCENGLIEHEFDHVFVGVTDDTPVLNPKEVSELNYLTEEEILKRIADTPDSFTKWFRLLFPQVLQELKTDGFK